MWFIPGADVTCGFKAGVDAIDGARAPFELIKARGAWRAADHVDSRSRSAPAIMARVDRSRNQAHEGRKRKLTMPSVERG